MKKYYFGIFLVFLGTTASLYAHDVAKEVTCTTLDTSPNKGIFVAVIRDDSFGIRLTSVIRVTQNPLKTQYVTTFLTSKFIESNARNGAGYFSADNFGLRVDYLPDYAFFSDGHLQLKRDGIDIDEKVACHRR